MSQQPPSGPPNPPGPGWGGPPQPPPGQGPGQYGPPPGQPPYGPPPGQPPYGPPGQYAGPPPSGGGKSKGLIIGIVIAVLVVVGGGVAAAILLLGGDDNEPSSDDPLASAQAFVDAWKDGDCDAITDLMTEKLRESAVAACDPDDIQGEPTDPKLTDESGDSATAVITVNDTDLELALVKEDGKWLIDGLGGSESSTTPDQGASSSAAEPDQDASSDLQEFADTFVEALRAKDCATLESMVSQSFKASNECDGGILPPPGMSVDWGDPQVASDTAITLPATVDGDPAAFTLLLTQEDGEWKVSRIERQSG